jgi:hypothetical protein
MGFSPSSPYPYIAVNDDDDDEDGVMDNKGGSLPGDDDDLVPMLISDNSLRGQPDVVSLGIIHGCKRGHICNYNYSCQSAEEGDPSCRQFREVPGVCPFFNL